MQIKFKWLSNQWRRRPQNEIKVDSKSAWQSCKRIKHFDVWTSDWTIKRTIQWMEEELINEWMIYWTNERTNGRTKDRANERTNTWTNEQTKTVVYKGNRFKETRTFDTKVYFKPTDTLELLHKKSHHPNHTFKGLIKSQILRYVRICNNKQDVTIACRKFFVALVRRGYSERFLQKNKDKSLCEFIKNANKGSS